MIVNLFFLEKTIEYDMEIDYLTPSQTILSELGHRLARVRKQLGMTQTKLAEESGIGVATVRRIESGQSGQMDSWVKIMKALRMTATIEAFLPENFDSPRAQVLSDKKRRSKKEVGEKKVTENIIQWGDQTL